MNKFGKDGLIEITVKRKARKYRDVLLYLTVAAPPLMAFLFLDVFGRHPAIAMTYLFGMIGWDVLFAIAQKKPRAATRGRSRKTQTDNVFRIYSITDADDLSNEEVAS